MGPRNVSLIASTSLLLGFFALSTAHGALRTWDGGGASNDWSDSSNWNPDFVPNQSDDVIFDGTSQKNCIVDVNSEVQNITITAGFGSGVLTFTNDMIVNNTFDVQGGTVDFVGAELIVRSTYTVSGGTILVGTSVVVMEGNVTYISGDTLFHELEAFTPGATVYFGAGSTVTVTSAIEFNEVSLLSESPGQSWYFDFQSSTMNQTVTNVQVRDSDANPGTQIDAYNSVNLGNNLNWVFGTLTELYPSVIFTSSHSVAVIYSPGPTFDVEISSDVDFESGQSTFTLQGQATFYGLLADTTYFVRVKLSTEPIFLEPQNLVSTTTLMAPFLTPLSPTFAHISSETLAFSWSPIGGGNNYESQLSSFSNFSVFYSTITPQPNSTFYNLVPQTTYWFRIRVSTEPAFSSPQNELSTMTSIGDGTDLNPFFSFVGSATVNVDWDAYVASFTAVISTHSNFSVNVESVTISTNIYDFNTNIMPDTTYYFQVKLTTEPDTAYFLNQRSTQTFPAPPIDLNPNIIFVDSNSIATSWLPIGTTHYIVNLSTDTNFIPIHMTSVTLNTSATFYGLNANTTYFKRVRISTDAGFHPNNIVSTQTHPPDLIDLNPNIIFVSSDTISADWLPLGTTHYLVDISTVMSFIPIHQSSLTLANGTTFFGLIPDTTFYFRVRISTDPGYHPNNIISTTTLIGNPTDLMPNFVFVSSDTAVSTWLSIGATNYVVDMSTDMNFIPIQMSTLTLNTSATFFGLAPNTTYYQRVRISTEPMFHPNNIISTQTFPANLIDLMPKFIFVSSQVVAADWLPIGTTHYVVDLSTVMNFVPLDSSSVTLSNSATFYSLMPNTTYFMRIRISTEPGFHPNNNISTETIPGNPTLLSPQFVFVSSDLVSADWLPYGATHYMVDLSTSMNFIPIDQSTLTLNNGTTFFGLFPDTTYYLQVRISTEIGYHPNNNISTRTHSANLLDLNPAFLFVSSNTIVSNWLNLGTTHFVVDLSTDMNFIPIDSSTLTLNNSATFFGLIPHTTYYQRVRISTEPGFHPNNIISTQTFPPNLIDLNPNFIFASSITLASNWLPIGSTHYMVDLSTAMNFIPINMSSMTLNNSATFFGLIPYTTYYQRVRISTEPGHHPNNIISTRTHMAASSPTLLTPGFFDVRHDLIHVGWIPAPGRTFVADISSHPSFLGFISSITLVNQATFFSLLSDTTYHFRVRLSTDPGFHASNIISTRTYLPPLTPLGPVVGFTSSNTVQLNWNPATAGNYEAQISTDPMFNPHVSSITTPPTASFFGLNPSTTYYLRVKISTEPAFLTPQNETSTMTAPGGPPLTDLNPMFVLVGSDTLASSWLPIGSTYYHVELSTESNYIPIDRATTTLQTNTTFFGLMSDTTYYMRVRISTEPGFHPNNDISTETLTGIPTTDLMPFFTAVSSYGLTANWNDYGSTYNIVFSTDNFATLNSSETTTLGTTNFHNLSANTQYFFAVKLASETTPAFVVISTFTDPPTGATNLNPFFSNVGLDFIDSDWTLNPGSSYTVVLATDAGFGTPVSSGTTGDNFKDFFSLQNDTTYWLKVKISTEPDGNYSTPISTKTHSLAGSGNHALHFDGNNDRIVTIPTHSNFDLAGNHTIEFWFRRNTIGPSFEHVISKDNSGFDRGWAVVIENNNKVRYEPLGVGGGLTSTLVITTTSWHHFALTRAAGGQTYMYINGNLEASGNTNIPLTTGAPLKFGTRENGLDDFNGRLDEVRFWNLIRTQSEIQGSRYNHLVGNEFDLVAYWNFDDGPPSQFLTDITTGSFNGTLGTSGAVDPADPIWVVDPIPGFGGSIDNTAPTLLIQNPADASTQTVATLGNISGTAQDNQFISAVDYSIRRLSDNFYWSFNNNGGSGPGNWAPAFKINQADGLDNWHIVGFDIFWATGTYEMIVEARDGNFNSVTSTSVFTVEAATETVDPTIVVQYPVDGSSYTASQLTLLSGTANDNIALANVGVRIIRHSDNYEWDASTLAWKPGPDLINGAVGLHNWSFNMPVSAWTVQSTYSFIGAAQDAAANVAHSTNTFFLQVSTSAGSDSVPPVVRIIHPASATVHGTAALNNLHGTASDNVNLVEVGVKVKNLNSNLYWNGSTFSAVSTSWTFLANPSTWSFFGIPQSAWEDGTSYFLIAQAKDANGNFGYDHSVFTVNFSSTNDTIPPNLTVTNPTSGGVYSPTSIQFNGTAGDNGPLSKIEFSVKQLSDNLYYDGVSFVSAPEVFLLANGLHAWNFGVPSVAFSNGSYSLRVRAIDAALNTSTQTVAFSITGATTSADSTDPMIAIQNPTNGTTYTTSTISQLNILSGTASDDTQLIEVVISLKDDSNLYWNGSSWSEATEFWLFTSTPHANWDHYVPPAGWKNGIFVMRARARDGANNVAYSSLTFTINGLSGSGNADTQPPFNFINHPFPGSVHNVNAVSQLDGHADDPFGVTQVQISLKSVNLGRYWNGSTFSATTEALLNPSIIFSDAYNKDWSYSIAVTAYQDGQYILKAYATDPSNNQSVATSTFTVFGAGAGAGDSTPPTVFIQNPVHNDNVTADTLLMISGTASDNLGLDFVELQILRDSDNYYWDGGTWTPTTQWLHTIGVSTWTLPTPISMWAVGTYAISARAVDFANNQSVDLNDVNVTGLGSAGTPPTVTVLHPQNTSYAPTSLLTISGNASDDVSVSSVKLRITNTSNGNQDWDPFISIWVPHDVWFDAVLATGTWSTTQVPFWSPGSYRLRVIAEDNTNLISAPVTVDFNVFGAGGGGSSDFIPPTAITNLNAQTGATEGTVDLTWTAPSDNSGTVTGYTIVYHDELIDSESDWIDAQAISGPPLYQSIPAPQSPGSNESLTVNNLTPGAAYFWAIRANDPSGLISPLSNSVFAAAKSGCSAGTGDGGGTAVLTSTTIPEATLTMTTMTVTIGQSGITTGGQIIVKVPDGWAFPQTNNSLLEGYSQVTTNNGIVSLGLTTQGPEILVQVNSGILNSSDTVTITYLARPTCGVTSGIEFPVLTQASACGIPQPISSQPQIAVTQGAAEFIGFDSPEKIVTQGQIASFRLQSRNQCGLLTPVTSNVPVTLNTRFSDGSLDTTHAAISITSSPFSGFTTGIATITTGNSELILYYRLSTINPIGHEVQMSYLDIVDGVTTIDDFFLRIIPVASGAQAISNVSVDTGVITPGQTAVTISPNGDGVNDFAFINFELGDPNLSWRVELSQDGFSTFVWDTFGQGSPARVVWDGRRNPPFNDIVPPATYNIRISAGGAEVTSSSITVTANGFTGTVIDSSSPTLRIANADVEVFGPTFRHTQTDSNGDFSLMGLPNGDYTLRINKIGYAPYEAQNQNINNAVNPLGNIPLSAFAKIIFVGTRSVTTPEIWGQIIAKDQSTNDEFFATVHFADNRSSADNGFGGTELPELLIKSGATYEVRANIPGYTVPSFVRNFSVAGETFTWTVSLTPKNSIAGKVRLANGVSNLNGVNVDLGAGLDENPQDGQWDLGYPSFFAFAYIPPGGNEASYQFPGLDDGRYVVGARAPGLTPTSTVVTIAGSSQTVNFTLDQTGLATINVTFNGDTRSLDTNSSGTFPLNVRLESTGFHAETSVEISTSPTQSTGTITFTGVPNGTYQIRRDPITGFKLSTATPASITVSGGSGSTALTFNANSGILTGTISLAGGSTMANDIEVQLIKGGTVRLPQPYVGNRFTFNNLETGQYTLSAIDNRIFASDVRQVHVVNGQTKDVGAINLQGSDVHNVSGVVRTIAAAPNHDLQGIVNRSTPTTIYQGTNTTTVSVLRVEAHLINPDGTTDPLPTISGTRWNPAKLKFGVINPANGTYLIQGLKQDQAYRLNVNTDFDNDGTPDLPLAQSIVSLSANKTDANFTLQDGASISGTLTAPVTLSGRSLTVRLFDVNLNQIVRSQTLSVVGQSASFSFVDLRLGGYLLDVVDNGTPKLYIAKPKFIDIEDVTETISTTIDLKRGATVRGKLANNQGQIITSLSNLPSGFKIKFISDGHRSEVTTPANDGTFSALVLPDTDYDVEIRPPLEGSDECGGRGFLPIIFSVNVSPGGFHDWDVLTLREGFDVTGTVALADATPIVNVPIFAYQSLARNLPPIKVFTNDLGEYCFEDLDSQGVRFYDFEVNPAGNLSSNSNYSQAKRTMVDLTSTAIDFTNLNFNLAIISGRMTGTVLPASGNTLVGAFGQSVGLPGASILLIKRGQARIQSYRTAANGTFSINLSPGRYDLEILAQNHLPFERLNIEVVNSTTALGNIQLSSGTKLSGTIRNADGSLPDQNQVDQLIAIDTNNNIFRANLTLEPITQTVDRYTFYGLRPGVHVLAAVDISNRIRILNSGFDVPNQATTLNLTFVVNRPQLVASFIQKIPAGVDIRFNSNQAFRNKPDDQNGNGTPDDNEFRNFVSTVTGEGTLVFTSVSSDRLEAAFNYTQGNETGNTLELLANFITKKINPATGSHFRATGSFTHHFGLVSQQEDVVTNLGASFVLPGGAEFSMPKNWSADADINGTLVRFQEADTVTTFGIANSGLQSSGYGAMALAKELGPSAYPPGMYRAITTLAAAPDVQDLVFGSFYDIFLPASVSRIFTNKPTLTLKYDCAVDDPTELNIYYFNEASGEYLLENTDRAIDTSACTISITLGHASIFTVLASSAPIIQGTSYSGELAVINFPNPFDLTPKVITKQSVSSNQTETINGTMMKISIPVGVTGTMNIDIYNVLGEKVRTITDSITSGGAHYYKEWDGRNQSGKKVASGVYIGRLEIAGQEKFFKMAVLK